ncbi:ABC transporter permease [Phocaeicola sp.]
MILHYLKIAIRQLLKYKTQNLISIIGLSVGVLCFSICLYCSRYIAEVNHCFTKHEHMADISLYSSNGELISGISANVIDELRKLPVPEAEAFTFMTYPRERSYSVKIEEGRELPYDELNTIETDSLYGKIFTPKVLFGSWEVASHTPNAIILTKSLAEKIFGNSGDPIGKQMTLTQRLFTSPDTTPRTGGIVYSIQAVIEDIPLNTSLSFLKKIDMLTMNDSEGILQAKRRENLTGGYGFALLREGKTAKQLETRFRSMNLTYNMFGEDCSIAATRFGEDFWSASIAPYFVGITLTIGILILLIGLLNFFHFLIGSFLNRQREYSIRKVAGCNSLQLFLQLFTQSVVIVFVAFLITFCLIEILSPYLHFTLYEFILLIEKNLLLAHTCQYMGFILLLCAGLCLMTVLRLRYLSIQTGMRGSKSKKSGHLTRNILLGIQFFICWIFVSLTVALYMQSEKTASTLFNTLSETEKANIISFPVNNRFMQNEEKLELISRIGQHSGIEDKLLADISYTSGVSGTDMQTEKDNRKSSIEVNIMNVSPNFFKFMNIPLLAGRTAQTNEDMVIDEVLSKRMNQDMLGVTWYSNSEGYTVCGIASGFTTDVYTQGPGFVFLPSDFSYYVGHCYLKCKPGKVQEVKQYVENILKEVLPSSIPIKVSTLLEDIYELQAIENKLKGIILFFSVVSLIITLLGVYSAITLDTERKQKEVAIRKVNGAGLKQIILLFARLYIRLLLVTSVIAFPLIYMLLQLWKRMYTVFFNDGICYWGGIFLGVAIITALTVVFRILKIARTNPAEVIKNE